MNVQLSGPIVRTENLEVGYGVKTVLSLIDLAIEKGKFISLLGPNGVGKTTLLRTMSRLLMPRTGTVFIEKKPINEFRQDRLAGALSVVLTEQVSPGFFSVFEFVALGRYPHTGFLGRLTRADKQAVTFAIEQVNAGKLTHRQFETLSDGERQKILLARALAQEPRLILLDEPTLHLDLKHRLEVMSILQKLCRERNITVLASLHDVDIAAKISDQVILLKDGGVMAWGPPEEVLDAKRVASLYDFNNAGFNPALGSIEIRGANNRSQVFVVGGMGCGAVLYRLLAKRGFGIVTGVLHENDIDCYVASSLGAKCVTCAPMEKITANKIKEARLLMRQAAYVIDAGFPISGLNRMNTDIITDALARRKPIFTLRKSDNAGRFLKKDSGGIIFCHNKIELMKKLELYH